MSIATGAALDQATFSDFVQRLGHHVRGNGVDWHYTADAIFTVQARKIIFGIDRDYTEKTVVAVEDSMYFSPQEYWDEHEGMREQALLFANLRHEFKPGWYWSSEQHAANDDYTWNQNFTSGCQSISFKSASLRARAVRRIPAE